ncbi:hypothetical protein BJ878DRAFT_167532 [Calycina marina]|uniref:Uncharacterized protein n=1 Tax=Calycina marina TaxID=1763456 RepID=A0A9P7YZH1_9HELO|nr:hypothetical protein BJ878DRAFT_167532 [Calycina marina]
MLRFIRPLGGIMSISRLPMSLEKGVQQGTIQPVNVRKVQLRPPPFRQRIRRVIFGGFMFYIGLSIYSSVLDRLASKGLEGLDEIEGEEEEGDAVMFIPFIGTTKEIPVKPYRGNDPEWQQFVTLSQNSKLINRIKDDLAQHVLRTSSQMPAITLRTGKKMKLRRFWLDIDFPQAPPPEFERSGIEINLDEGAISWATVPVDSLVVFRTRQVLWPTHMFKAIWAMTKTILLDEPKWIGHKLGLYSGPLPPTMKQLLEQHQKTLIQWRQQIDGSSLPRGGTKQSPTTPFGPRKAVTLPGGDKPSDSEKDRDESEEAKGFSEKMKPVHEHFFRPFLSAKRKFAQMWKPARPYPPRGCIMVSGLVEVDAPLAWLVFDVKAHWDPKTKAYDENSLMLALRRYQPKKQSPI